MKLRTLLATSLLATPALAQECFWPGDSWSDHHYALTHSAKKPAAFMFFDARNRLLETFTFTGIDRRFTEGSGKATPQGTFVSSCSSKRSFRVSATWTGFVASNKTPPKDSPYLYGLKSSSLKSKGGPIDPKTWRYYTKVSMAVTGLGDLKGWNYSFTRTGPAFQLGVGANLRNIRYGASGWFKMTRTSRGSGHGLLGTYGDYNFNLDKCADDCIATYPIDHGKFDTCDSEKCSDALDLRFGQYVWRSFDEVELVRRTWNARSRTSSNYARSYAEIRVNPKANCSMSHTEVCFSLQRDNGSHIRFVDVRADEDRNSSAGNNFRNVLATLRLPDTDKFARWTTSCIDLSKISALQGLTKPYSLRLYFYGTPKSGSSDTYLDNVLLCGEGKICKKPTIRRVRNPILNFITTNCFTIEGADLDQVTDVRIGNKVITSMNSNDFGKAGYFVKRRDGTLCVYPPLCMEGSFKIEVRNRNCGSAYTGSASIRLTAPSGNRMATTPLQDADAEWCAFLYGKNRNNYYCIFASPFRVPSRLPGIIDLGIGNNFQLLIAFDSAGPRCWPWCIGKWPSVVKGRRLYFQTLVIDLNNLTKLPFEVTNITSTLFR